MKYDKIKTNTKLSLFFMINNCYIGLLYAFLKRLDRVLHLMWKASVVWELRKC